MVQIVLNSDPMAVPSFVEKLFLFQGTYFRRNIAMSERDAIENIVSRREKREGISKILGILYPNKSAD